MQIETSKEEYKNLIDMVQKIFVIHK